MKRLIAGLVLAFGAALSYAATLAPVQLLNPAGSTSGQAIISTGPSSPPAWASINAATLNGTTFAAPGPIGSTTPGTGAFTNLSATAISGVGFSNYLSSPTAIGNVTPSTGAFTSLSASGTVTGISGRLLAIQTFTANGTYTPTAGANRALVEVVGAGGGSGGSVVTTASQIAIGQSGNGGAYGLVWISSGLASQSVTVGTAGAAGAAGAAGGAGTASSFGSIVSCAGGNGGGAGSAQSSFPGASYYNTTAATCSGSGTFIKKIPGAFASPGLILSLSNYWPGAGGLSPLGVGGVWASTGSTSAAVAASGYGAGASGAASGASQASALAGAAGAQGIVIVYEYQ